MSIEFKAICNRENGIKYAFEVNKRHFIGRTMTVSFYYG